MAKASPGPLVAQISGRLGNEVAVQGRNGLVLRARPTYKRPTQPAQTVTQNRMTQVMACYNTLTRTQAMAWNAYADGLTFHSEDGGAAYHPTGQNVFVGYASKYLQAQPDGAIPLLPPDTSFDGDTLALAIAGQSGQITWTASAPNTPLVRTELLAQKLKTPRRAPVPFYKSQAFVAFAPGALGHALPFAPGWYACAARFVCIQTGQMTAMTALGVVEVD